MEKSISQLLREAADRLDGSPQPTPSQKQTNLTPLPTDPVDGNNLYGDDLRRVLQEVKGSEERMAYILMEKINPTPVHNILLRRDTLLKVSSCVWELGVYGVYIRQGNRNGDERVCKSHDEDQKFGARRQKRYSRGGGAG